VAVVFLEQQTRTTCLPAWWEGSNLKFRDFHKNVKTRIYVLFAFGTVQATTLPFMAIYFARNFGEAVTGILLTVSIVASMFSGVVGGYYADRIGRKKLMVGSEAAFLLAYVVMALANSPWYQSPVATFVTFLITNVCWGIYGPADEAMLMDVTTAESRQLMYSIFYWVGNLTMAVGASLGAMFFEHYRFILFSVSSLVVLGTLLTTIFRIDETYQPIVREVVTPLRGLRGLFPNGIITTYRRVLTDTLFLRYIVGGMLVMAVEFQLSNYIGIHLAKDVVSQPLVHFKDWVFQIDGVKMLGFLQTENTVMVVLLAAFIARWMNKYQDKNVLFFGIILNTVGYSLMIVTNAPWLLIAAMFVATIGEVASVPIRQTYLGDIAPSESRSSYIAVNGLTFSGSRIMASLAVMLGAVSPSWFIAVLSMLSGIFGYVLFQSIVPGVHQRRAQTESLSA
jgi:DHA1 family multidrug resistance protein B-like MFS transporter